MNNKLMNPFNNSALISHALNLRQFVNFIPLMIYVILAVFISLFIVHRTTIPNGYNLYWFEPFTNGLRVTFFILGLISCYSESKWKLVTCFCYFILSFVTYRYGHSWVLFDLFFIPLFLSKKLNLNIVIDIFFYVILIGTFVTITLDLCDCLPKFPHELYRGNQIRYNLGFSHPNSLGLMFMLIGMLFALKIKQMNLVCFLLLVVLGSLSLLLPKSYSSATILYCMSLFSFFKIIFKYLSLAIPRKLVYLFAVGILTCIIVGVYAIALFDLQKDVPVEMSQSLLARFSFGAKALAKFGFSVFGQDYHPVGTSAIMNGAHPSTYFVVDCLYFYLPIFVGIIPSLVYLSLFYRAVWISINRENYSLMFVLMMISVYSISEFLVVFPLFMFVYFDYNCKSSVS